MRSIENIEATLSAALRYHADMFTAAAEEARKGAALPEKKDRVIGTQPDGALLVDITPTPGGFARIAVVFDDQARQSRELADQIEESGLVCVLREAGAI